MKKHCAAKILQGIREKILYEHNHKTNSYKFSYKFVYILALSFRINQKRELNFQQVGDLVRRNIWFFVYSQFSIQFIKGFSYIFLFVLYYRKCIHSDRDISNCVYMQTARSSHSRCSIKKDVLKNFAKFTVNHHAIVSSFNSLFLTVFIRLQVLI